MKKKWLNRVFGMFGGAMVMATNFGANLQTFAAGATEITSSTEELAASGNYSIGTIEGFLKFRDLVNEGKVDSTAKISLTESLDLTEGGTYEHGYCDRPMSYKDGKVTFWYVPEVDKYGNFVDWKEIGNGGGGATHR